MTRYLINNSKKIREIFIKLELPAPDLTITSPPYYDILNYENNIDQIGFGQITYEEYLTDIVNIFQDCFEISSPNSSFWLIIDTYKRNGEVITLPFDINSELKRRFQNHTWKLKEIIIWDKEKNLPWNGIGKFKNHFEYLLFYTKGEIFTFNIDSVREINDLKKWWKKYPERYNPDGKAPSNIWQFKTPLRGWGNGKQKHLCPFPFPLVEKIISISSNTGDTIFDPFAGSGTVIALSNLMGRNAIGIDINKKYYALFKNEVTQGAKEYWQKRVEELNQNRQNIIEFRETNEILRKLKSISNICLYLNKNNNKQFIFIATIEKRNNTINLWILTNHKVDLTITSDKLKDLLAQTKVSVRIQRLKISEAKNNFKSVRLYKYKFDKFYSYTATTQIENILKRNNADFYTFFYTDIKIRVT